MKMLVSPYEYRKPKLREQMYIVLNDVDFIPEACISHHQLWHSPSESCTFGAPVQSITVSDEVLRWSQW
jgi:hypothetical protein